MKIMSNILMYIAYSNITHKNVIKEKQKKNQQDDDKS